MLSSQITFKLSHTQKIRNVRYKFICICMYEEFWINLCSSIVKEHLTTFKIVLSL